MKLAAGNIPILVTSQTAVKPVYMPNRYTAVTSWQLDITQGGTEITRFWEQGALGNIDTCDGQGES